MVRTSVFQQYSWLVSLTFSSLLPGNSSQSFLAASSYRCIISGSAMSRPGKAQLVTHLSQDTALHRLHFLVEFPHRLSVHARSDSILLFPLYSLAQDFSLASSLILSPLETCQLWKPHWCTLAKNHHLIKTLGRTCFLTEGSFRSLYWLCMRLGFQNFFVVIAASLCRPRGWTYTPLPVHWTRCRAGYSSIQWLMSLYDTLNTSLIGPQRVAYSVPLLPAHRLQSTTDVSSSFLPTRTTVGVRSQTNCPKQCRINHLCFSQAIADWQIW